MKYCICNKNLASIHPVWHAWRVDWSKARPNMPKHIRRLLGQKSICQECVCTMKRWIVENGYFKKKSFAKRELNHIYGD